MCHNFVLNVMLTSLTQFKHSFLLLLLLTSDLNFPHSQSLFTLALDEQQCTAESPFCVCAYDFLIEDLKGTIQNSQDSNLLISRLILYECQQYRLLPQELFPLLVDSYQVKSQGYQNYGQDYGGLEDYQRNSNAGGQRRHQSREHGDHPHSPHFGLSQDHRPNGIKKEGRQKRRRRQVSEDASEEDAMSRLRQAVPKLGRMSGEHVYAYFGHKIQLPCHTSKDKGIQMGLPHFEWVHSNGDPVSSPGATIDQMTGNLNLFSVQLSDTDIYNCTLREIDLNGRILKTLFHNSHQLSVVTGVIKWLSFTTHYTTRTCSVHEMSTIQSNLKEWVSIYICPICTVHDVTMVCDSEENDHKGPVREYELSFALTAFNVEDAVDAKVSPENCREVCIQAVHETLLRIVEQSVRKLLALPIRLNGNRIQGVRNTLSVELMWGCLGGFEMRYKICFPCLAGHYSLRGNSDCLECPKGTYQDSMGSSSCIPCHEGHDTVGEGSTAEWECLPANMVAVIGAAKSHKVLAIILSIFFGILLLIILALLVLCCCFPDTKYGRFLRRSFFCLPCCDKLRAKFGRKGKYEEVRPAKKDRHAGKHKKNDGEKKKNGETRDFSTNTKQDGRKSQNSQNGNDSHSNSIQESPPPPPLPNKSKDKMKKSSSGKFNIPPLPPFFHPKSRQSLQNLIHTSPFPSHHEMNADLPSSVNYTPLDTTEGPLTSEVSEGESPSSHTITDYDESEIESQTPPLPPRLTSFPFVEAEIRNSDRRVDTGTGTVSTQKLDRGNQALRPQSFPSVNRMNEITTQTSSHHRSSVGGSKSVEHHRKGLAGNSKNYHGDRNRRNNQGGGEETCLNCSRKLTTDQTSFRSSIPVKETVAKINATLYEHHKNSADMIILKRPVSREKVNGKGSSKEEHGVVKSSWKGPKKHPFFTKKTRDREQRTLETHANTKLTPRPQWRQYCHHCVRPTTNHHKHSPSHKPPPPPAPFLTPPPK